MGFLVLFLLLLFWTGFAESPFCPFGVLIEIGVSVELFTQISSSASSLIGVVTFESPLPLSLQCVLARFPAL